MNKILPQRYDLLITPLICALRARDSKTSSVTLICKEWQHVAKGSNIGDRIYADQQSVDRTVGLWARRLVGWSTIPKL